MITIFNPGTGFALVVCLSSDTKPASPPNDWLCIETDTAKHYRAVSGAWVKQNDDAYAPVASPTFTGTVTLPANQSLTTPVIGAATGISLAATGAITSSGTAGLGYAVGAGGTVTQLTSKATGVTLNKLCGTITLNSAALAATTIVTFTVTNTTVGATDVVVAQHDTVGTIGAYTIMPNTSAAGSFKISVRNNTAGSLSEAIVIRFAVVKAVAS